MSNAVSRLSQSEEKIERGVWSMVEGLKEIFTEESYKETHKTFEAYVKDRWDMSSRRVQQLFAADDVRGDLRTIVRVSPRVDEIKNEAQLRELTCVPTEDLPKIIKKVIDVAGEQRITAAIIRSVVKPIEKSTPKPEKQKPVETPIKGTTQTLLDAEDVDEVEVVEHVTPAAPVMTKAEQSVFNASVLKEIIKSLQQAKRLAKAVENIPGMEMFLARQLSIEREIESAKQAVTVTIPHSVCIRCNGKGCPHCGNLGWVNSTMAGQLEHVK